MRLRALNDKDAPFMLEWIKDSNVNRWFRFNPESKNEATTLEYIRSCCDEDNIHLAIASDTDEYLGTVSLKNIDRVNENAEYAIVLRSFAQGSGAARFATEEILKKAFNDLGLKKVYLNVLEDNVRAIKFYEKCGFVREGLSLAHVKINGEYKNLCWYAVVKD